MELMPGYKQSDVGIIPEEWDSEPCSKLCVKIQDGTHFSPTIRGNDFLYLTSKNVRFGYLDVSTADRIDAAQHEAIYKRCDVKYGDLLLTKDGANTGNAALNTLTEQFSLLSSVALLRFDPKQQSAAYFLQQCLSAPGQQRMKDAMSGNAITRLTLEKIRKLRFPVAPLPEQRAIAQALSDVDALLATLDQMIVKKRDLKQAAMQQLLTGKTRLPGFSGDWETKQLKDFAHLSKTGINPSSTPESLFTHFSLPAFDANETPVIESGASIGSNKFVVPPGAVLLSKLNPRIPRVWAPNCMPSNSVCSTEFLVLIPNEGVDRNFFKYLCASTAVASQMELHAIGTTGSHQRIHPTQVMAIEVKTPIDDDERSAISSVLRDIDAELSNLNRRRDKTVELKQAMMQELLTGKTRLV